MSIPVFGVLHVADLYRDRAMWEPAKNDWRRAGRFLRGEWPRAIPARDIAAGPMGAVTLDQWVARVVGMAERGAVDFITLDGEWPAEHLSMLAMAAWGHDGAYLTGIQLDYPWGIEGTILRPAMDTLFRLARIPVVIWNAMADVPKIEECCGFTWEDYWHIEDPMQAHGVLWSELAHEYEFAASVYGEYPKLKHLRDTDKLLYNWGDILDLAPIWRALRNELRADPGCERIYRETRMPLLPELARQKKRGIAVATEQVPPLLDAYGGRLDRAARYAEAYCGLPVILGSQGVKGRLARYLNEVEGFTLESIGKDEIAEERAKFLPIEQQREEREYTDELLWERIGLGAHPLLELRAQYAKDKQIKSHYLDPLVQA